MKNRVLITSVGRKVSLIKAFKEVGWHVTGQDKDYNAIALNFCDVTIFEDGEYGNFDLIIPTRDAEIKKANLFYPEETVEICLDKFIFYKWCKERGFKTPEVYFVKPRVSSSGKEVECVWQELIEGEEYSVDLFAWEEKVISVVPRRRVKVLNGESVVTTTVQNPIILDSAIKLSTSLGLQGHNVLQCFQNQKEEPIWTDVNLRFGGASVVSIKAGCQSPTWYLELLNGKDIEPCIGKYKVGLTGYSYPNWTII